MAWKLTDRDISKRCKCMYFKQLQLTKMPTSGQY